MALRSERHALQFYGLTIREVVQVPALTGGFIFTKNDQ